MACINEAEYALCSVEDREYFKGKVLFPYAIIDEVGMASHFIITDPRRDKLARFIFISSQRTENDPPATINISGIEKLHLKYIAALDKHLFFSKTLMSVSYYVCNPAHTNHVLRCRACITNPHPCDELCSNCPHHFFGHLYLGVKLYIQGF